MKYIFFIIVIHLFHSCGMAQMDVNASASDEKLAALYLDYETNKDDYDKREQLLQSFKTELTKSLSSATCKDFYFPQLGKSTKMVVSSDSLLTVVSWDWLNNGSQKIYESAYRYVNPQGEITTGFLYQESDEQDTFAAALYFDIQVVEGNGYLIQGYGTQGGGREHFIYRKLQEESGSIAECTQCFNGEDMLVYEFSRGSGNPMEFDKTSNTISFPEYQENEETGFLSKTGDTIRYVLNTNKFVKVE